MSDPSASIPIKFPIEPQPEMCGHCGQDGEAQGYTFFCFHCGKQSHLDGTPIHGNAHFRANLSETLPAANHHGIDDF